MMKIPNQKPKMDSDLNEEELDLLTKIVNDKYSIGAFSGMIFNAVIQYPDECPKNSGKSSES